MGAKGGTCKGIQAGRAGINVCGGIGREAGGR